MTVMSSFIILLLLAAPRDTGLITRQFLSLCRPSMSIKQVSLLLANILIPQYDFNLPGIISLLAQMKPLLVYNFTPTTTRKPHGSNKLSRRINPGSYSAPTEHLLG